MQRKNRIKERRQEKNIRGKRERGSDRKCAGVRASGGKANENEGEKGNAENE